MMFFGPRAPGSLEKIDQMPTADPPPTKNGALAMCVSGQPTGPNRWGETSEISGVSHETFALKVPPFQKKKKKGEIFCVADNDLVPSWPSMWWRTSEKKTTRFLQDIWFPRFCVLICFSSPFLFWLPLATESGSPSLLDLRPSMRGFIVQLPGVAVAQNARTVRKMQLRREENFTFLFVVLVSVCILEI